MAYATAVTDKKTDNPLLVKYGNLGIDIARKLEEEDRFIRDDQLLLVKKCEYFARGLQHLYYDYQARDIKDLSESPDAEDSDRYYTKVINIFRSHMEAVIAALSAEVPHTLFVPDDAQSSDDISTAASYINVGLLIQRHNKAKYLLMRALYIIWTQGFVAAYTYSDKNLKYGSVSRPIIKDIESETEKYECPDCGYDMPADAILAHTEQVPMYEPEGEEGEDGGGISYGEQPITICPQCGNKVDPTIAKIIEKYPAVVGNKDEPKSRQKIKVYGLTHVKVSPTAVEQEDCGYLTLEYEIPYARGKSMFPRIDFAVGTDSSETYDRYARDPQGHEQVINDMVTYRCTWLRPWTFYSCYDVEEAEKLCRKYKKGMKIVSINHTPCDVIEEDMDECWTIHISPISSHIHPDPMGKPLLDVNEMQNELCNLTLDTIEHGLPETYVDSTLLDFDKYKDVEAAPGLKVPVERVNPNEAMSNSFYTIKSSTLSQEVGVFSSKLDQYGQLVVGAFPTIYGGTITGGSKTYAEYAASRQQALQRLSITWDSLAMWWSDVIGKAVPSYVKNMLEDERFVMKVGENSFVNMSIMLSAMNGKIGSVEAESASAFPMSWAQKRDMILELIRMNNPMINEVLMSPENAQLMVSMSGIPELIVPGADSRAKQYAEIRQLINTEPTELGEGQYQSSVYIDPELDNHGLEIMICKSFLTSKIGQDLKQIKPKAYLNVLAHLREHQKAQQAMMEQQPPEEGEGEETQNKPIKRVAR